MQSTFLATSHSANSGSFPRYLRHTVLLGRGRVGGGRPKCDWRGFSDHPTNVQFLTKCSINQSTADARIVVEPRRKEFDHFGSRCFRSLLTAAETIESEAKKLVVSGNTIRARFGMGATRTKMIGQFKKHQKALFHSTHSHPAPPHFGLDTVKMWHNWGKAGNQMALALLFASAQSELCVLLIFPPKTGPLD